MIPSFFKRLKSVPPSSGASNNVEVDQRQSQPIRTQTATSQTPSMYTSCNINLDELESDPGLRTPIDELATTEKQKEDIRRAYLLKGPCQPIDHNFPFTNFGGKNRRFTKDWYKEGPSWLEYSIAKDQVFCLCCYLFKSSHGNQGGGDTFVGTGFNNWKEKTKLKVHVGGYGSVHNVCHAKCLDLMNQKQHIDKNLDRVSEQAKLDYRIRLTTSIKCIRFILHQGLAFRGHDESEDSENRGNFVELVNFLANENEELKVVLKRSPDNHTMMSPKIQKELTNACAYLTTKAIIAEIVKETQPFSLLVDESRDVSVKEQMAIVIRYVDKSGCVVERFLGMLHVSSTTLLSLKSAIDVFFGKHGLSLSSLRGQGYDGASNMRGEFNGLKSLILKENKSAFYVHCFAHQLQLALVGVVKKHPALGEFFQLLSRLSNTVGASCKRRDHLRESQKEKVVAHISSGNIETGRGLNQENTIKRPGDTRWGSHHGTITSVIKLFPSVIDVLRWVQDTAEDYEAKGNARSLLKHVDNFEFVFLLFLMKTILGITNSLSQALQKKDQDLVNAMRFVKIVKQRLNAMRNEEESFEMLMTEASTLCRENEISVPQNMEDKFGVPKRGVVLVTNMHHFKVELMYTVLDYILEELNNRFDEINMRLLECMACLEPSNAFEAFDRDKIVEFAGFYPSDFCEHDLWLLGDQLDAYYMDVSTNEHFSTVEGIAGLAKKMVELKLDKSYPQVYLIIKLALVLPVATATVERAFSAMHLIKSPLRNRMGDEWLNDTLVVYIEMTIFQSIGNDAIIKRFQDMGRRRIVL